MSFHTFGYSESLANVVDTNVQPIPDGILTIQNNQIIPQFDYELLYFAAIGAALNRARITSASIRQFSPILTYPWTQAALFPTDPNVADFRNNSPLLRGLEEFSFEATPGVAGPTIINGFAGITRSFIPAPAGPVFRMRGTGTTTLVAEAWTLVAMTWANFLPAGSYVCVGGFAISTTGLAFRFVFENQAERPGGLAGASNDNRVWLPQLNGGLGSWGQFNSNRMPNVEMVASAADTAEEVFLDFVRIG